MASLRKASDPSIAYPPAVRIVVADSGSALGIGLGRQGFTNQSAIMKTAE
jgi:hypothetical protein